MKFFLHPGKRNIVPGTKHLILMVLMLSIFLSNAANSQYLPELMVPETENSFPGQWCSINDGYIYGVGVNQRTSVLRKRVDGQNFEWRGNVTSLNPEYRIENRIYSTTTPGLIFILVRNERNCFVLLKSTDGGMTFREVYTFGQGNGPDNSDASDVRLLRGMLELTRDLPGGGGQGTLFIGEYNVNKSRINGSINDRVRIMKSQDQGNTWTRVVEWNTNGSNQVGHIHAMKQDPYTGEIYVCIGDYTSKIGILKWDGVAPWADNTALATIGSSHGFRAFTGLQRYRTCDVLFDENYFYTFADTQTPNNPGGTESGIWRGRKDFSSYTRVDNQIYDYDPMHVGWFGEKIGDTFIYTTSREYMTTGYAWKELNTQIYVSKDGTNWYRTGAINWRDNNDPTENRYISNVFSGDNKMYIDCVAGAGHSSTIKVGLTRQWKTVEDPVILHPVFYVGNWAREGNDSYSGSNAESPKRTLSNLLNHNLISAGSRVRISEGTFNESAIIPTWSGTTVQGRGPVVIEGQGKNYTHIARAPGITGNYALYLEASRTPSSSPIPLVIRDLHIYVLSHANSRHTNYVLYNSDSYIKTVNCRLGDLMNDNSPLVYLGNEGASYLSENTIHTSSTTRNIYKEVIRTNAPSGSVVLKNCVLANVHNAITINHPETILTIKNCTFNGITNTGIRLGEDNNRQPFIKNTIFICEGFPVEDLSGITENDVDFNFYSRENRNVTDGDNSLVSGTSPGFNDPANDDYSLKSNSPCAMGGIRLTDVISDINGRIRFDPPSIGAFEDIALIARPEGISLSAVQGSTALLNIRSNTTWTIVTGENWISVSLSSGTGNAEATITTLSNNEQDKPRTAHLTITGPGVLPINIYITQSEGAVTPEQTVFSNPLKLYPNPVIDLLTVNLNDEKFRQINLFNSEGVRISEHLISGTTETINFTGLPGGIYIIEFRNPGMKPKRFKIIRL